MGSTLRELHRNEQNILMRKKDALAAHISAQSHGYDEVLVLLRQQLPYLLESNARLFSDKMGPKIIRALELSANEQRRYYIAIGIRTVASYVVRALSNGHRRENELAAQQPLADIVSVTSTSPPVLR